jgi:predicted enzyme related to lactoylglutathione lyase
MEGFTFCVIDHDQGNGGCLIEGKDSVTAKGILVYLNVDGRIRAAEALVTKHGGKVLETTRSIGPHGFRAVVLDSEGNRVALHSSKDA